jgi:hypothetical protein
VPLFDELCQTASAEIAVPAERAFVSLADPRPQGEWPDRLEKLWPFPHEEPPRERGTVEAVELAPTMTA